MLVAGRIRYDDNGCMSEVTHMLSQIDAGDPKAAEQLLPLVYDELRKLAAAKLAHEKPGQTLSATALVHEAYLRMVGAGARSSGQVATEKDGGVSGLSPRHQPPAQSFNDRAHFFRTAAEAMRRILVDNARRKRSAKGGGELVRVELPEVAAPPGAAMDDLIAVSDALTRFEQHDPAKAGIVKLRYFAGLTIEEVAEMLGISHATAERHWTYAKTWLYRELARSARPTLDS
jgi:RNA polymerase sigma factor (sigma-70 family)